MATGNIREIEEVFHNLKLSNISNNKIYSTIHNMVEKEIKSLKDLPDNNMFRDSRIEVLPEPFFPNIRFVPPVIVRVFSWNSLKFFRCNLSRGIKVS